MAVNINKSKIETTTKQTNPTNIPNIADSGNRTELETGSHKDIKQGRGRFDLLPHYTISKLFGDTNLEVIYKSISSAIMEEDIEDKIYHLENAIGWYLSYNRIDFPYILKDLAILYEKGAMKYSERDWELGRPMEIFIDSALRHLTQFLNHEKDEDHGTAFVWNIISCIDTIRRLPEMAFTYKAPTTTKGETK